MMPNDHTPQYVVPPYGRADAIADGLLIAVPDQLTRMFGFDVPVAVTQGAWADTVAWPDWAETAKPRRTRTTETDRVTALLWAARTALTGHTGDGRDIEFVLHRIPAAGPDTRSLRRTMVLHLHPGDCGEPVATIGVQQVDPIGHFQPVDEGHVWWPAVGFDADSHSRTGPVVTADTLDDLLSALTTIYPGVDVTRDSSPARSKCTTPTPSDICCPTNTATTTWACSVGPGGAANSRPPTGHNPMHQTGEPDVSAPADTRAHRSEQRPGRRRGR